jgi:hypothetical protein
VEEWNSQGGKKQCGTVKEARNSLGSENLSRKRGTIKEVGIVKEARNSLGSEKLSRKRGKLRKWEQSIV